MSKTNKEQSLLVQSVIALDDLFSEIIRVAGSIDRMELKTEGDFDHMQQLMIRFTECGQDISSKVIAMSTALNEAKTKAEAAAQLVSARAQEVQTRQAERQKKMDAYRMLGEKVNTLTSSLQELKQPDGVLATKEDRAKMLLRLAQVEAELRPLIDEAQALKVEAREAKMKALEQGADSLGQSLLAVSKKLSTYQQSEALNERTC